MVGMSRSTFAAAQPPGLPVASAMRDEPRGSDLAGAMAHRYGLVAFRPSAHAEAQQVVGTFGVVHDPIVRVRPHA